MLGKLDRPDYPEMILLGYTTRFAIFLRTAETLILLLGVFY